MATFKLKCVGCKMVEMRPAEDCRGDQPMCNKCYMPMVLESVTVSSDKPNPARKRAARKGR